MIKQVDADDFELFVMNSERPVLVDFWADWCGPCKALAPTLDDVAQEYEGALDIAKVDIVANPDLAERFGVRNIPLLMIVENGQERGRSLGALSRSRLQAFIDENCDLS